MRGGVSSFGGHKVYMMYMQSDVYKGGRTGEGGSVTAGLLPSLVERSTQYDVVK